MTASRNLGRLAALVFAFAALVAHAGGPLNVCNSQALKYPGTGTVNLNYDGGGTLGPLSKAQADALVGNAVALWTNVGTSTVVLGKGGDLPVDVTVANYATYFDNYSDGLNPVIYDTDGSIVDQLLGVGAKGSVLGFAGSAYFGAPTCQYAEGQAVISGYLLTAGVVTTGTMSNVITHEVGHLIGLDHTQLDSSQGLASSNYPMMYPVAYRTTQTLHEDDIAAISALYPDPTLGSVYGQVTGNFMKADGVTAVLGANLWAQETTTGKVYSIVSDYLKQGTGFWKLLLPAGTYTLHAEAIDSTFNGGSSVGPYSETYPGTFPTDASFQAPLYSGATPMAPVTLGGSSPVQFVVSPGCTATSSFRIDGSGAVTGNCSLKTTPAIALGSSVNPSAIGQTVTFTANLGGSAGPPTGTLTFLDGATAVCSAVALSGGTATCTTAGLASGSHSITASYGGSTSYNAVVSSAVSQVVNIATPTAALVSSPNPSTSGQAVAFTATVSGTGGTPTGTVSFLDNGSTFLCASVALAGGSATCTISTLASGSHSVIANYSGSSAYHSASSNVVSQAVDPTPSSITSPAPGSSLGSTSVAFTWDLGTAVTNRFLAVGTYPGGNDIFGNYESGQSQTVSGLPSNGGTIYVMLMSMIGGAWQTKSYTYTAMSGGRSAMIYPVPGSTLSSTAVVFSWTPGTGVTNRFLAVGTHLGGNEIFGGYPPDATSQAVTGLPVNGTTVYVRLMSFINGAWTSFDYTYTGMTPAQQALSNMTSPVPGSVLGPTTIFNWTAGTGVTNRFLTVGTILGGNDIYGSYVYGAASQQISGVPRNGAPIYVRLMSLIGGAWQTNDYIYSEADATRSVVTSPIPGSALGCGAVTLGWDAGSNVTNRFLAVGTYLGGNDIYGSYTYNALSQPINVSAPAGATIYVRLMSQINGAWQSYDFTYSHPVCG